MEKSKILMYTNLDLGRTDDEEDFAGRCREPVGSSWSCCAGGQ